MTHPPEKTVTVVVATYKRAHLIEQTLPSYLQEHVIELIVIDDCSPDNTPEVLERLAKADSRIRFVRQPHNMGQIAANNRVKAMARGDYIYFGDDDSVLLPGSISALVDSASSRPGSVIGASAVYMHHLEKTPEQAAARRERVSDPKQFANLQLLKLKFDTVADQVIEVPVCHAAFLIERELAQQLDFDPAYLGNAYREETDYLLRYRASGGRVFFDSRAVQVNYPPNLATGGARKRFWKNEYFIFRNTWLLLTRNKSVIRQIAPGFSTPVALISLLGQRIGGVIRRNRARSRKLLKKLTTVTA